MKKILGKGDIEQIKKKVKKEKIRKAWNEVKDVILLLILLNYLIGQLEQIDLTSLMAPKTIVYEQRHAIPVAEASTATPEAKAPQNAKMTAIVTAYSEVDSCHYKGCPMASGKRAYIGAVACPRSIELGTRIMIDDKPYVCEDRTAITYDGRFDIFMGYGEGSYQKAINYGIQEKTVTILQ